MAEKKAAEFRGWCWEWSWGRIGVRFTKTGRRGLEGLFIHEWINGFAFTLFGLDENAIASASVIEVFFDGDCLVDWGNEGS